MKHRMLGRNGPSVSELGLGCMGMSEFYGATDEAESLRTIHRALELGINFFDTADMYGPYRNERLLGRALAGRRTDAFIATKFGNVRDPNDPAKRSVNGSPAYVRASCDSSLERLGIETIDLYYQHRVDTNTPIEETVGAMAELVTAGKVRYLGLSEASAATIRRAHAVHPIAAVQTEFSLFSRDVEDNGVLATLRDLGIALVPYSPLGRGLLSGTIRSVEELAADDYRRISPRFQGANFAKNLELADAIREIAGEFLATPAQVALAWVLAQGDDMIPIPGTKHVNRLEENAGAVNVTLSTDHLRRVEEVAPKHAAFGDRYGDMSMVNR